METVAILDVWFIRSASVDEVGDSDVLVAAILVQPQETCY